MSDITRREVLAWLDADPEEIYEAQKADRAEHTACFERIAELEERITKRGQLIEAMTKLTQALRGVSPGKENE